MRQVFIGLLAGFLATSALAHSKINKSSPADGAVLAAAPVVVSFDFTKKIRLTKVELIRDDNDPIQLEMPGSGFENAHEVPLPTIATGTYMIHWRGLGGDGHVMNGTLSFEVN